MGLFASKQQQPGIARGCPTMGTATDHAFIDEIGPRLADEYCPLCSHRLSDERHNPDGLLQVYVVCACQHILHQSCFNDHLVKHYNATIAHPSRRRTSFVFPASSLPIRCPACSVDANRACKVQCNITRATRMWPPWSTTAYARVEQQQQPIATRTRSKLTL